MENQLKKKRSLSRSRSPPLNPENRLKLTPVSLIQAASATSS